MNTEIEEGKQKGSETKTRKPILYAVGVLVLVGLMSLILVLVFRNDENSLLTQDDQIGSPVIKDENALGSEEINAQSDAGNEGNTELSPATEPIPPNEHQEPVIKNDEYRVENQDFTIIIPKLELEAPIVSGVENFRSVDIDESEDEFADRFQKALEKGTVHYPGSQFPGESGQFFNSNFVVLGHSSNNFFAPGDYNTIFSELQKLEPNDLIMVHYQGIEYTYEVYDKEIVEPTAVEVLTPGEVNNNLTIATCHPPGTSLKRLVVLAKQITPEPDNNFDISSTTPTSTATESSASSTAEQPDNSLKEIPIDF